MDLQITGDGVKKNLVKNLISFVCKFLSYVVLLVR